MSKVRRYTSYASTYGGVAQEFSSDGDSVDYDDYAEAIEALRGLLDDSCYRRLSIAEMQEEFRLGNQAMPALIAARAVLERAP